LPETETSIRFYLQNYTRPHAAVGALFLGEGRLYPAWRHYEKALSIHPAMGGLYLNMASYYANAGYLEMAEAFCRKELAIAPDDAGAHYIYGNVLLRLGRWDQAVKAYDRSLSIRPDFKPAQDNRQAAEIFKSQPPPPALISRKSAKEYGDLAQKYEGDGEPFLALAAREVARAMENSAGSR